MARALLDTPLVARDGRLAAGARADPGRTRPPEFTDVAQNLAFTVLGWLAGGGDFGHSICIAVNCGKDTDCTGATLGALLGILDPAGIGEEWLRPIGRELGAVARHGGHAPPGHARRLHRPGRGAVRGRQQYYGSRVALAGVPDLPRVRSGVAPPRRAAAGAIALSPDASADESLVATDPLPVFVTYLPDVALAPGCAAQVGVRVANPTGRDLALCLRARVPDGWSLGGAGGPPPAARARRSAIC